MSTDTTTGITDEMLADLHAEPSKDIHQALARVQSQISHIGKGGRSTEGGSYSFRRIDDVIKGLHPILAREQVLIVPTSQELLSFDDEVNGRKPQWSRMVLLVTYRATHSSGTWVEFQGLGVGLDNGDKGPGKALSYAYKAAVSQLFSIPTDDPAMDNEMTPEADSWWGGWDHEEGHAAIYAELKERSNQLDKSWRDMARSFLKDERILNASGRFKERITVRQAEHWEDKLKELEHMAGTEPFGLETSPAADEPAAGADQVSAPQDDPTTADDEGSD